MTDPDASPTPRPLVVWTTCHPWIQQVVDEVCPDGLDAAFLDLDDEAAAARMLPLADAVVCLSLTASHVALLERCRLVMHNGVGFDAIDLDALRARSIPVAVTPALTPEGVAEHVVMMLLALSRQLPAVQQTMRAGGWGMLGWREGSHTLFGKTLGIVGLGRIGTRVAHLGAAFGCRLIYSDIVEIDPGIEARYGLERRPLEGVLAEADLLTLHVPLTPETTKMIDAEALAIMKPTALLINASRGPVVDLAALEAALRDGRLAGAGLDVFDPEPPSADLELLQMPNVICTPHIASGTVERQYAINRAQFANAQRVFDGLEPFDRIA